MVARSSAGKLIGTVLGNYRLEQLLEPAKSGPIFLAASQDGSTYQLRFVGMPALERGSGPISESRMIFLGRFQQEANQLASLQHPYVLSVLDYGSYQGTPYLVYPYMPLSSLRVLSTQKGPVDVHTVGRYLRHIASALDYAHKRAILHRNLSTSCIFMQNNQQIVVAEFGLMRLLELSMQAETGSTTAEHFEGSTESSAPEQLLGKPVDVYTDVYALGAVLYRLLAGHAPFTGKTSEEVARQHLYARVPLLMQWRTDLPAALDRVVGKALAKDPLQRYQHVVDLVEAYYRVVDPQNAQRALLDASGEMPTRLASPATGPLVRRPSSQLPAAAAPVARFQEAGKAGMSRRRLLTTLGLGGGIVAASVSAGLYLTHNRAGATAGNPPAVVAQSTKGVAQPTQAVVTSKQTSTSGGTLLAHVADVPVNSAKQFPIANQANPGLLIHLPNNNFVAFDSTCTHAGCAVDYKPDSRALFCPCHGAVFDPANQAAVLQGPAPTPLAQVKISVNADGTITTST